MWTHYRGKLIIVSKHDWPIIICVNQNQILSDKDMNFEISGITICLFNYLRMEIER